LINIGIVNPDHNDGSINELMQLPWLIPSENMFFHKEWARVYARSGGESNRCCEVALCGSPFHSLASLSKKKQ